MPTASTAQILGNNECFEPYTSNIYNRRVLAGEFAIVHKHLLRDLMRELQAQLGAVGAYEKRSPSIEAAAASQRASELAEAGSKGSRAQKAEEGREAHRLVALGVATELPQAAQFLVTRFVIV